MKTLHAIKTEPTLIEFLEMRWPEYKFEIRRGGDIYLQYNPGGVWSICWEGPEASPTREYRRWLKDGQPSDIASYI